LNTLRLFEAAGRQLSFKTAAQELGITPSAVSHGVQTLEDWLGSPLFHRSRRGIALTPAGEAYLPAVAEVLKLLASASDHIPNYSRSGALHISVAPTFGSRIVLPRLQRFRELHPHINVAIDTNHQTAEFPRDGADLAIRLGHGDWPDAFAEQLLAERLVPVCSPFLLERMGEDRSLCNAPIIHVTMVSQDWQAWARAAGHPAVDCQKGLRVDTIQMAIEAAIEGLGIAIGRRPLVDPELSSGALVRFSECEIAAQTSYWLVAPRQSIYRPDVQAFRDWLLGELESLRHANPAASRSANGCTAPRPID